MKLFGRTSIANRRAGISLVEVAITVPLLMLVLFGLLEYGWAFLRAQDIQNAARHGARLGVVNGATAAEVTAGVDQLMLDAGLESSGYTITLTPADPASLAPGQLLTVEVTVDYDNIDLVDAPFIPVPSRLRGETSMAREGPSE